MQVTPSAAALQTKPTQSLKQPDLAKMQSNIMQLDANNDGRISNDEFAAYRVQKQTSGQYIPQDGPANTSIFEGSQQAMFEALLRRDD